MRCALGLWIAPDVSAEDLNAGRVRRWMRACAGYDDSEAPPPAT